MGLIVADSAALAALKIALAGFDAATSKDQTFEGLAMAVVTLADAVLAYGVAIG